VKVNVVIGGNEGGSVNPQVVPQIPSSANYKSRVYWFLDQ